MLFLAIITRGPNVGEGCQVVSNHYWSVMVSLSPAVPTAAWATLSCWN